MHRLRKHDLSPFLGLAIGLFTIWVLLSGKFEIKFLLTGLLSSLVISYISIPLLTIKNVKTGKEFFVLNINHLKLIPYSIWVVKEIFKSAIDVSREILKFHVDYEPRIVYFSMPFENPMAGVILSNSIILTPGTITLDVTEDGIFEVHAINQKAADDMLSGTMALKVAALFGETCEFVPLPNMEISDIPREVF